MSYLNKKTRVFMERGDRKPERRRSEARMKRYPSTVDIRAWCDFVEDRRQHILELVTQNIDKCMGKLVPIDVILDLLLEKYKADIAKLKKCVKLLWQFISKANLSDDERKELRQISRDLACREFIGIAPEARMGRGARSPESTEQCPAVERHARELAEVEALVSGVVKQKNQSICDTNVGKGTYSVKIHGAGKVRSRIKGIRPGFGIATDGTSVPGGIKVKAQGGRADIVIKNAYPSKSEPGPSSDATNDATPHSRSKGSTKSEPPSVSTDPKSPRSRTARKKITPTVRSASSPPRAVVKEEPAPTPRSGSSSPRTGQPKETAPRGGQASPRARSASPRRGSSTKDDRPPDRTFEDSNEISKLRDQLAAREALCNELQVNADSLKQDRDELQRKLNDCLKELDNFKKLNAVANPVIPSSCQEEIEALEVEIKLMRSGNLSPEQEADVIKKEVEVIKRYCSKLKTIEDENEKLKQERDTLKSKVALAVKSSESDELTPAMEEIDAKLRELEAMTNERNMLASKVKDLEEKLMQYQHLPGDVEDLRQRSGILDSVLEERDALSKKAAQIKEMENEINVLRQKADRVDELERELKAANKYDRSSGHELRKSLSKCNSLERELSNMQAEKDAMARRIGSMRKESDNYKCRAKECEMLKLERDRLQIKLNELADIQMQYDSMIANMKMFDGIKAERDIYKQKYEEVLQMECQCEMLKSQVEAAQNLGRERDALQRQVGDLESCICDQEDEIKRLVLQVDNMSKNKDETNQRMKDTLENMRTEMKNKDALIAESEEHLAAIQSQVRNSMQGTTNEAALLRRKLNDLEMQLREKDCYIKCLENRLKESESIFRNARSLNTNQRDMGDSMRMELDAAKAENRKLQGIATKMMSLSGDEHVRKMLKQSECAVRRVVEELGKQYREWDNMRNKHQRARQSAIKKECCCRHPATDFPISASCEKLKEEMDIIQKEKEKLEKIVKQIQDDNTDSS